MIRKKQCFLSWWWLFWLFSVGLCGATPANAQNIPSASRAEQAKSLIVKIQAKNSFGAGILFSLRGGYLFIATAHHVVQGSLEGADVEFAFLRGVTVQAELLHASPKLDLAVLRVDLEQRRLQGLAVEALPFDLLGQAIELQPGASVYPVGHPDPTATPAPVSTSTPTPRPAVKPTVTPTPVPQPTPRVTLRSTPRTILPDDAQKEFGLDAEWQPLRYIDNGFEKQGEVVIDHATGLMWQRSGSEQYLTYDKAQAYVQELKHQRFAGYADWCLPTAPELISLLQPQISSKGLYIDPIFDSTQEWCWSADRGSSGSAWLVSFYGGNVDWDGFNGIYYVRAVRSRQ